MCVRCVLWPCVQAKLLIQLNATLNSGGGKGNTTATATATANASGKGNTSTMASVPALRAGYPMYDGFDDSSTFMSREIVLAFAEHYPEPGESTLHPRPALSARDHDHASSVDLLAFPGPGSQGSIARKWQTTRTLAGARGCRGATHGAARAAGGGASSR